MKSTKVPAVQEGKKALREPSAGEALAIESAKAAQAARPARASLAVTRTDTGALDVTNPHTDGSGWWAMVQETFGTTSQAFVDRCILKLANTLKHCDCDDGPEGINAALALIAGIAPQNEVEAAMAVQAAITHSVSTHLMGRSLANSNAGHVEAAAVLMGMATKASRTMVAHIEALAKLRGGGRQIIEHRYINVNAANAVVGDGNQAVFGDINAPRGANSESDPRPHGTADLAFAPFASMPCAEPPGEALPSPCDAGAETVSDARRQVSRRAAGARKRALRPREADKGNGGAQGALSAAD